MLRSAGNSIRIALLDDHTIVRYGMARRFSVESDFDVVGVYATGGEMISGLRSAPADVLVVDYSLGPTEIDGINLLRVLKIKSPSSKILVVSAHNNPATVALVMHAGAQGFVAKTEQLSVLVEAIRVVAAGGIHEEPKFALAPDKIEVAAEDNGDATVGAESKSQLLSPREREVIRCCLEGMSVIDIARKFSKSGKTISNQKRSAMTKLGLRTDSELFELRNRGNEF